MKDIYLITGSSGFLGRALCHHFGSQENSLVVGFDMEGPPSSPPNTDCLYCDLTSDESVQKTFHLVRTQVGNSIKAVIHLAAYYSFSGKDNHLYKDLTVDGTGRLLRELQSFDVGQFIFSSSMLVYKPSEPGKRLDEQAPLLPNWQYPKSKVDTENLIQEVHGKIPAVILRIAGVYDDKCDSIPLSHQIQRIYEKQIEGHMYSGSVDVRQSFIHVNDLVSACDAVIQHRDNLPDYSVFNIGEEDAMSYDEIQKEVAGLLYGTDWKTFEVPKPIAKTGAWVENTLPLKNKPFIKPWMIDHAEDNFEISIEKARTLLKWEPENSLRNTLPRIVEDLQQDPLRWYEINKLQPPEWVKDRQQNRNRVA